MFPIVDRRYGSTLLALYGSGSVQRSIGLPLYKYGISDTSIAYLRYIIRVTVHRYLYRTVQIRGK